ESSINMTWAAASDDVGVDHYTVYRGTTQVGSVKGTTFTDTGLSPNTSYTYTVTASDAAGNESAPSSPLSASASPDTSAPAAPVNLSKSAATDTSVSLGWSSATDDVGVDHYTAYRGTTRLAPVTGTTFTDTGLAPITSYTYTVTAWDKAGNQGPASSPALSASTLADTIPPTAPTALSKSG